MSAGNKKSKKIDGQKMRGLAESLKSQIPGLGFALIVFDFESGDKLGNYISNVHDDFMINALELQLKSIKKGKTFPTPES